MSGGWIAIASGRSFLRKRTVAHTTSRHVHSKLHHRWCLHDHEHRRIEGSFTHQGVRQSISDCAAHYTKTFAKTVAKALLTSIKLLEDPFRRIFCWFGHFRKWAQTILRIPRNCDEFSPENLPSWEQITQGISKETPRVGVHCIRDSPLKEQVQQLIPEMQVQLMIACRGTGRFRIPNKNESVSGLTLRKTESTSTEFLEVIDVGAPEEWQKMSRTRQVAKCGPARLSLTIFGSQIHSEASCNQS